MSGLFLDDVDRPEYSTLVFKPRPGREQTDGRLNEFRGLPFDPVCNMLPDMKFVKPLLDHVFEIC